MKNFVFDRIEAASTFETLPIRLVQDTSPGAVVARVLLLSPALIGLAVPLVVLAAGASAAPSALALITDRPLATVQVAVGLILWAGLFLWPLTRVVKRLGQRRLVEITASEVTVTDRTMFGTQSWSAPLAGFEGVAHHVRSSLSGLRHELVLVHGNSTRNVLLAVADRMPATTIERCKALLGLPEVPAKHLYGSAPTARTPAQI